MPSFSLALGLSQPDNQSSIPASISLPDLNTVGGKDDNNHDDGGGAPLRFTLRDTTQVNHDFEHQEIA